MANKSIAFLSQSKNDMLKSFKTIKRLAKEQKKALMEKGGAQQPQKRKITKADIGGPRTSQFVHAGHIGWTPESGFDVRISSFLFFSFLFFFFLFLTCFPSLNNFLPWSARFETFHPSG